MRRSARRSTAAEPTSPARRPPSASHAAPTTMAKVRARIDGSTVPPGIRRAAASRGTPRRTSASTRIPSVPSASRRSPPSPSTSTARRTPTSAASSIRARCRPRTPCASRSSSTTSRTTTPTPRARRAAPHHDRGRRRAVELAARSRPHRAPRARRRHAPRAGEQSRLPRRRLRLDAGSRTGCRS